MCFALDSVYAGGSNLAERTVSYKTLTNKSHIIGLNPRDNGYQIGLESIVHYDFW